MNDNYDYPTTKRDPSSTNVAELFQGTLKLGIVTHFLGIIGDGTFAARTYVKKTKWFRLAALIACSIYSIIWLGWLIWIHIALFNH